MKTTTLIMDKDYTIGRVDKRLFGSFIEHIGRAVYTGIYEPGHPLSDSEGFRKDVLALVRRLQVPVVRYPGGNFVSGFRWEDSIGPAALRPKRLDLAWFTTESNAVGLHEFASWAKKAEAEVMYAVNLGTRGPEEARQVVEYANHPGGSALSDLRIQNGAREPFGIKLWCLGNEMDGNWQMGQKTAYEYGRCANEAAKLMKWVDNTIELVACGSSGSTMDTFGTWERTMLEQCYDQVDYVSLHRYYANHQNDTPAFLARSMDMDAFIKTVIATCDAVGGQRKSKKRLYLSFDEWNVWYHSNARDRELTQSRRWDSLLPLCEEEYNLEDALLAGSMLITLLRNADRVKIACLAQLVNVIAPIMTRPGGGAWAQTTYYPFLHTSLYGRGTALRPLIKSPVYDCSDFEGVPYVDAAAVLLDDGGVTLFAVNRDTQEPARLLCDLRAFGELRLLEHIQLYHPDTKAANTEAHPDTVLPTPGAGGTMAAGKLDVTLSPQSWNVIRLTPA